MIFSSNARSYVRRSGKACGLAVCLLLSAPLSSFAQSAQEICPKGYSVFETVCLNEATGDVVNQSGGNGAGGLPLPADNPASTSASATSGG